ncbi:MAG: hypothetical protein F4171_15665 [Gammaproteobacteria bacterium]|nr:hypothetical protein [Gammaproteobacteria bacterium]MYG14209.1 hypothetical protein [Gammaproteobacteria bacterium]MYK27229.1 hypothetical protein [Gammaproteobacteria bacterium]
MQERTYSVGETEMIARIPSARQRELIWIEAAIYLGDRWEGTIRVDGDYLVAEGLDIGERCRLGGASVSERVEYERYTSVDCDPVVRLTPTQQIAEAYKMPQ